ncbi:MAG: O-antigen ligase family protein [bacterium]
MNALSLTLFALLSLGLLIRYPEITLALFLLSGTFKSQFNHTFPEAPDVTIICGLILIAGVIIRLPVFLRSLKSPISPPKHRPTFKFFLTFAGLVAMMLLSLFAVNDNRYGLEKTARFATLTGLALFTPLITIHSEKSLSRFLLTLIGVALLMVAFGQPTFEGLTAFGANHIATGRTIGVGFLSCIYFTLRPRLRSFKNILLAAGLVITNIILGYGVFSSGARGVLISLISALTVVGLVALFFRRGRTIVLTGAAIVTAIVIIISVLAPDAVLTMNRRIDKIVSEPIDRTAHTRVIRAEAAITLFQSHPLTGAGIGGFNQEFNLYEGERGDYPHNLFLEVAAELGLVGLILITLLLFIPIQHLLATLKVGNRPATLLLFTFVLYFLINAFFSGDLNDNRFLFAALGLCLTSPIPLKERTVYKENQWQPASAS